MAVLPELPLTTSATWCKQPLISWLQASPSCKFVSFRPELLNGCAACSFDEGAVLRCELARKNMYIKDEANAAAKRGRYETAPGQYGAYPAAAPASGAPAGGAAAYYGAPEAAAGPRSYAPVTNTKDNPPCNTLFIGNLGEHSVSAISMLLLLGCNYGSLQALLTRSPSICQVCV